jgi:hypothetical protein
MELSEILEKARARLQVRSDRALCRELGIDIASLPRYRAGTSYPTDDRMVRICLLSGVAPERGLLLLNLWRSRGEARTTYRRIAKIWEENAPRAVKQKGDGNAH